MNFKHNRTKWPMGLRSVDFPCVLKVEVGLRKGQSSQDSENPRSIKTLYSEKYQEISVMKCSSLAEIDGKYQEAVCC